MAKVLIIEDNPSCAELARVVCDALGHTTAVVGAPDQALALAPEHDLALVAWAHGPALVAALRAQGLRVVTTTSQPAAFVRSAFAGVEVLSKPFVVSTLRSRLDAALTA